MARLFLARLTGRCADRRDPRRSAANPAAGRGAGRGARRPPAGQVERRSLIQVPIEHSSSGRFAGRPISPGPEATSTTSRSSRPGSGACAMSTARSWTHRADDAEATVRARMEQQLGPLHDVADYYRARRGSSTTGRWPPPDRGRGGVACSGPSIGAPAIAGLVITRKSARRVDQMRRAGRVVAEVLAP